MVTRALIRTGRSIHDNRAGWLAAVLFVSGVVWATGSRLSTRLDKADFLPVGSSAVDSVVQRIGERHGGSRRLIVYIASDDSIDAAPAASMMDGLHNALVAVDGVESVRHRVADSILTYLQSGVASRLPVYLAPHHLQLVGERISRRGIESAVGGETAAGPIAMSSSDPLGVVGVALWTLDRVSGSSPIQFSNGYFTVRGRNRFFAVIDLDPEAREIDASRRIVQSVEGAVDRFWQEVLQPAFGGSITVGVVGRPVSYVSAVDVLRRDIIVTGTAALLVVLFLLGWFFRSFVVPVLIMLPVAFGFGVAAAVGYVVWGSVSLMAFAFVAVLIGLAVDFGIHVAAHYGSVDAGTDRAQRMAYSIVRPGRAIILGGLTSAVAFASLGVTSYPVAWQVAALAGSGIVATIAASLIVLPLGLSFVPPRTLRMRTPRWFGSAPARSRGAWVALLIVAVGSIGFIEFEPHPWNLALRGNPETAEMNQLNEDLGISMTPLLLVSSDTSASAAIERDRRAVELLRPAAGRAGVSLIESVTTWLPSPARQDSNLAYLERSGDLFSPGRFARDYDAIVSGAGANARFTAAYRDLVAGYLTTSAARVHADDLPLNTGRHLFADGDRHLAVSYLYLEQFPWAAGAVDRLIDTMQRLGFDRFDGTMLAGEALGSREHAAMLGSDLRRALLVVGVIVFGLLWVAYRSPVGAGLCFVPVLCGLSAVAITMALLRIELNMLTLSVLPLLIGLSVDDGVHVVERSRSGQSVETIAREAGACMVMTTVTTVAGLACVVLARFDGMQELGLLGAVGLTVALVASLTVVPAIHEATNDER